MKDGCPHQTGKPVVQTPSPTERPDGNRNTNSITIISLLLFHSPFLLQFPRTGSIYSSRTSLVKWARPRRRVDDSFYIVILRRVSPCNGPTQTAPAAPVSTMGGDGGRASKAFGGRAGQEAAGEDTCHLDMYVRKLCSTQHFYFSTIEERFF